MANSVLTVVGGAPRRIGGLEILAAEFSRSLRAVGWRSILAFPAGPTELVAKFFKVSGADVIVDPLLFNTGFAGAKALFSMVRKTKADYVYLSFTSFLSPMAWGSRLGGAKAVFFTDQFSRPEGSTPRAATGVKRLVGRFLAAPYKQVFCVSDYVRRDNAVRGYVPPERLTTLYNGIDLQRTGDTAQGLQFRRRFGIAPEKILVSQVSWLRPEKGIDVLIRAASVALPQESRLHFLIAGDGPCRDEYMKLCKELGVENAVTFTGLIDDPLGEGLYAASDIICQVSRWQEAFAFSIVEAMSHGKPVIGTLVGGIPEAVEDGVTGYVVPPNDPSQVADRIVRLAKDAALRTLLGRAGFERARLRLDLRGNVAGLLAASGADCFVDFVTRETEALGNGS